MKENKKYHFVQGEKKLEMTIQEAKTTNESRTSGYNLEKMGEWNVVEGSKMLGEYKGMEQFGWLADWRLYDKNGVGIMVFSLGPGSVTGGEGNNVVCARIITGQNHLPLHYKPLKKKDIPQEILLDIQRKRFSES